MKTIVARNVSHALPLGVDLLKNFGVYERSRAGDVLVCPEPVTTVYTFPQERVLFSEVRDANPFFHLMESMWMLAGRNDAEFLNKYVHDFGLRFADNGIVQGAYGWRWRQYWDEDQLEIIISRLKKDPNDRRVVLGMWDPGTDLQDIDAESHLKRDGRKDIPCNTHVYLRIQNGALHVTVCCRSNDIIWGAYGANAVHFSFLQEYLANRIGVEIGKYYQISNNFHAYVDELEKLEGRSSGKDLFYSLQDSRYKKDTNIVPLDAWQKEFDAELYGLLEDPHKPVHNEFLQHVVKPAMLAHAAFKRKASSKEYLQMILSDDWRTACTEWIERRKQSQETRAEADKLHAITPGQGSKNKQLRNTAGRS